MAFSTDAPHWSLWMLDKSFEDLVLPDDLADPSHDWEASWTLLEANDNSKRTSIEGALDMSLTREEGAVRVVAVQESPMYWGMSVETAVEMVCQDGLMLRPLRWSTDFVTRSGSDEVAGTSGSSRGRVADGVLQLHGLDTTRTELPGAAHLTSSWGVLGAIPRLTAAGIDRIHFSMLEELTVLRPNQRLERFGEIDLELGGVTWTLTGWRHWGTGQAPIHYWVSPGGWPMLVTWLHKALVCSWLSNRAPAVRP